jgi:hypothetical protein
MCKIFNKKMCIVEVFPVVEDNFTESAQILWLIPIEDAHISVKLLNLFNKLLFKSKLLCHT